MLDSKRITLYHIASARPLLYDLPVMEIMQEIIILFIAFIGIWIGSGLILSSIDKLAGDIKHSSFLISFFVLGFFTSLTETGVALNSIIDRTPQVSAGNLLGGVIVLLLFVIPMLGIFGKGIKLNHDFGIKGVLYCILLFLLPFVLLYDRGLSVIDGFILVTAYFILSFYLFKSDKEASTPATTVQITNTRTSLRHILTIIFGVTLLIVASNYLVEEVVAIASSLKVSAFLISLLVLSIGTNLPEITLAIRSVLQGKTGVALGNYLGSAVFNIFILGIVAIISGGFVIESALYMPLLISMIGFITFYFFIKSNNTLSNKESMILLLLYIIFILLESLVNF